MDISEYQLFCVANLWSMGPHISPILPGHVRLKHSGEKKSIISLSGKFHF